MGHMIATRHMTHVSCWKCCNYLVVQLVHSSATDNSNHSNATLRIRPKAVKPNKPWSKHEQPTSCIDLDRILIRESMQLFDAGRHM